MSTPLANKKIRIGDILVAEQIISQSQLDTALEQQKKVGRRLGKVLVDLGYVTEDKLLTILSKQLNIPFIDLAKFNYNRDDVRTLKETVARRFRVVLLKETENKIILGMSDPTDIFCLDEVDKIFKKEIEPVIVKENDLLEVLDIAYGNSEKIASLAEELSEELGEDVYDLDELNQNVTEDDAPVIQLIHKIFEEAIKYNASDIHIEPDEKVLRIRLRIDGLLTEQSMGEIRIASALVVRLKIISGLDISEKRLPQDGRFNLKVNQKSVDIRISTMPVQYGESVVMRLLVIEDSLKSLDEVGMTQGIATSFRSLLHQPHGLILVTGPTGSGKTTTLFAALSELNTSSRKIITVEDPVEYRLPRLNQVQVNEKIGLDFIRVLKASLRQDPDVLLIGEIRDKESATIALRAAMTGHLVFSTLHTNDAISTAVRLLDMEVDPFVVASSLRAIIAQRLVRRLCTHCKEEEDELHKYRYLIKDNKAQHTFFKPKGCLHCFNTGYKGRAAIFEYLQMTPAMADALRTADLSLFNQLAQGAEGFKPLVSSAMELAIAGEVPLQDVESLVLFSDKVI